MRIHVTHASWLLTLLALMPLVQGCDHKKVQAQAQSQPLAPPIVDTQPAQPATIPTEDLPPPVVGPPPSQPATNETATKPVTPPKKPARKKPAPAAPAQPAQQEASNASGTPSPSVSAIGQLSGGASGDQRSQTEEMINATEKGVNGITRSLNDSETKTAAQIHEFLKQAREALATGDVDGALTLAKKAKVLLAELNQ
jgi:outer membrane biosynthesis protein TonB